MEDPTGDPTGDPTRTTAEIVASAVKRINNTNFGVPRSVITVPERRKMTLISAIDGSVWLSSRDWLIRVEGNSNTFTVDAGDAKITRGELRVYDATAEEVQYVDGAAYMPRAAADRVVIGRILPGNPPDDIVPLEIENTHDICDLSWEVSAGSMRKYSQEDKTTFMIPHFGKLMRSTIESIDEYHVDIGVVWSRREIDDCIGYSNEFLLTCYEISAEGCVLDSDDEVPTEFPSQGEDHIFRLKHRSDKSKDYRYDTAYTRGHVAIGVVIEGDRHRVYWHVGSMRVLIGEFADEKHWYGIELLSWRLFVVHSHRQLFAIV